MNNECKQTLRHLNPTKINVKYLSIVGLLTGTRGTILNPLDPKYDAAITDAGQEDPAVVINKLSMATLLDRGMGFAGETLQQYKKPHMSDSVVRKSVKSVELESVYIRTRSADCTGFFSFADGARFKFSLTIPNIDGEDSVFDSECRIAVGLLKQHEVEEYKDVNIRGASMKVFMELVNEVWWSGSKDT